MQGARGGYDIKRGVNLMLKRVLSCDDRKGREWAQGEHQKRKIYSSRPPDFNKR